MVDKFRRLNLILSIVCIVAGIYFAYKQIPELSENYREYVYCRNMYSTFDPNQLKKKSDFDLVMYASQKGVKNLPTADLQRMVAINKDETVILAYTGEWPALIKDKIFAAPEGVETYHFHFATDQDITYVISFYRDNTEKYLARLIGWLLGLPVSFCLLNMILSYVLFGKFKLQLPSRSRDDKRKAA